MTKFTQLQDKLVQLLHKGDIQLSPEQIAKLVNYVLLLEKWNKAYNLTAIREPEQMLVKHILDSLMVGKYLNGMRFIDVGTGPGLPGIPLAIANPDKHFVLLDSLGKRVQFLRTVIRELGLNNVEPVLSRVEAYQPKNTFDGILSRAFASLDDMVTWCEHLRAPTGAFYALKGVENSEEIIAIQDRYTDCVVYPIVVPELKAERHLILVK